MSENIGGIHPLRIIGIAKMVPGIEVIGRKLDGATIVQIFRFEFCSKADTIRGVGVEFEKSRKQGRVIVGRITLIQ